MLDEVAYKQILDRADDAIIVINQQQKIVFFNDGAEHIFQYRRSEVLGRSLGVLIPERFRNLHLAHVEKFGSDPAVASKHAGARQRSILGRRKDGDEFPADATILKVGQAPHLQYAVILRDLTQRVTDILDRLLD